MKQLSRILAHPVWLFLLIIAGIFVWANSESKATDDSPRYRIPHPITCNGCKVASMQRS
ncbi:MAG: hypothetical protein JWN86_2064 [Planctomycetota bacterium]|nr:hypothetical protein [Planctomycetota bacterium]